MSRLICSILENFNFETNFNFEKNQGYPRERRDAAEVALQPKAPRILSLRAVPQGANPGKGAGPAARPGSIFFDDSHLICGFSDSISWRLNSI